MNMLHVSCTNFWSIAASLLDVLHNSAAICAYADKTAVSITQVAD